MCALKPVSLRFRDALPEDAAAVAALHADSWRRHYRGAYADSYLDGDVLADRLAVWTPRLAAAAPGAATAAATAATVVADEGGTVIGFVHVVFDDDGRWGSLIDNLHVAGSRQRGGLGTALLARAAGAAAERAAAAGLYLWVLEQNVAAQLFYAARGGVTVERGLVGQPGGVPGRLHETPGKLRIAWPDAAVLAESGIF